MGKIKLPLVTFFSILLAFLAFNISTVAAPLTSDQAFNLHVKRVNDTTINANWKIAKTFHLYKDKVSISLANENGTVLGKIDYPKGLQKENQVLGKYSVYEGNLSINIPVKKWGKGNTDLLFKYQGCKGEAMCYPPVSKVLAIAPPANASLSAASTMSSSSTFSTPSLSSTQSLLKGGNLFLILGSFFVFGLFLSLTPCVLPMIPILVGLVLGQKDIKTYKAFLLSLSYVLGMAITYAVAGIITALLGNSVQAILQNVYVITACSIIFVLLSLSLFGLYELQLPSFLTNRLNNAAGKTKSGSYLGVFIMGVISSLIISPCVSAPLTGTLIYIATTGNMFLGGSALFVLALGMGVLLLIAGTSGGKFLVKAGGWMQVVRYFLGVVMIAFAIWMLGRVIPVAWTDFLYGLMLVGTAIYMGAIDPAGDSRWKRFIKMIAFFILIWGVALSLQFFLPGLSGNNTVSNHGTTQIATASKPTKAKIDHEPGFTKIKNVEELDKLIAKAKKENKPVIIDYYADWCTDCKEMEVTTFKDLNVQQALKSFVAVQADITKNNAASKALKKKYKVFGPPYFVFLTPQGKQIQQMSVAGMINAKDLIQHLNIVTTVYGSQK
ncbi:MAG: protein-disulfide reductase DsbD [bacterium]|nr:protein-disulfide reductase DsbD [bacterium]